MGQKTNPISNRIGITRGWDSNWCGGNYAEKIAEDFEIRKYLGNRLAKAGLSRIVIERTLKLITVTTPEPSLRTGSGIPAGSSQRSKNWSRSRTRKPSAATGRKRPYGLSGTAIPPPA